MSVALPGPRAVPPRGDRTGPSGQLAAETGARGVGISGLVIVNNNNSNKNNDDFVAGRRFYRRPTGCGGPPSPGWLITNRRLHCLRRREGVGDGSQGALRGSWLRGER